MIRFECSNCHKKLGIPETEAGKLVTCPACKTKVRIPGLKPPAPSGRAPAAAPATKKPKQEEPDFEFAEDEVEELEPIEEEESKPARKKGGITKDRPVPKRSPARADEDEEEEDRDDEDDEDDRPKKSRKAKGKAKKKKKRDEDDEDDDDDDEKEKPFLTPDRIRGIVGVVAGGAVLVFALVFEVKNEDYRDMAKYIGVALGSMLILAGIYYLIKG